MSEPAHLEKVGIATLRRLLAISATLLSTLDLKQLLRRILDAATELTEAGAAAISLEDAATGELQLSAVAGMVAPEVRDLPPLESSVAAAVRGRQPVRSGGLHVLSHAYTQADGSDFATYSVLAVPLLAGERLVGALEVMNKVGDGSFSDRDLAALELLATQAAAAIDALHRFQQADLIAEAMHELKTPLMALTAAGEILARDTDPEKRQDLLAMVQRETARLSKMAQDFLMLARLEAGRAQLVREPIDLAALLDEVLALQEAQTTTRNISVVRNFAEEPLAVRGDYDRLKQVLLNLTSNAIKYNLEGGRIFITTSAQPDAVVVSIADTGPGIAPEHLSHLFERFYRVPDSEGFSEGAGLGLVIAKRILEEHGGRIEVESQVSRGTTFTCYLPLRP